jgi:hypothetical protein
VLAFRRCTASAIGPPFTTLWRRDPEQRWTFHTNVDPLRSCPRYFGAALHAAVSDDIELRWTGPQAVCITARRARVELALRLVATPVTAALGAAARMLPRRVWERAEVPRGFGTAAAALLRTPRLPLGGLAPCGCHYTLRPRLLWRVAAAAALIGGRDLGAAVELAQHVAVGDFELPATGLLVLGTEVFMPPAGRPPSGGARAGPGVGGFPRSVGAPAS